MAMSVQEMAKKWSRNLAGSTQSIKDGVNAVTQSPMEKAAARQDAYIAGVQRAVSSGKWQRGLRRVSLQQWKDDTIGKGVPRIAAGASGAVGKVENFLAKWMPHQESLKAKLASMPRGDLQTNIQRAVMAIEHNANFSYNG